MRIKVIQIKVDCPKTPFYFPLYYCKECRFYKGIKSGSLVKCCWE